MKILSQSSVKSSLNANMSGPSELSKRSQGGPLVNLSNQVVEVVQDAPEEKRNYSTGKRLNSAPETEITSQHHTKQSTGAQLSLPLQWIDEQELKQNKSGLRKTIRSYARRDTSLRQQRLNAASKPNTKTPRNIAEKSGPEKPTLTSDQSCQAESQAILLQDPHMEIYPPESYHLAQTTTVRRNKSEEAASIKTGVASPGNNATAVRTAKDRSKDTVPRHQIRRVPVCRSRLRRRIQQSLPETSTHETTRKSSDDPSSDNYRTTQIMHPSLNAKNVLLNGTWRDDPFNIRGLVNNPRAGLLLSHHQQAIASTWRPNVNRAFLVWSFSNEVLLHSLLYCAAAHLYALTSGNTLRADILHHKGEVLRLINESLDDPIFRTSDAILGALGYLVIYEEMYGSHEAASFHRKGLRRLLHLRKDTHEPVLGYFLTRMLPITGIQYNSEEGVLKPVIDRTSHLAIPMSDLELTPTTVRINLPSNAMHKVFTWLKNSFKIVSTLPLNANDRRRESYLVRTMIDGYLQHLDVHPDFPKRDCHLSWLTASKIYIHTITATRAELEMLHETERGLVKQLRKGLENMSKTPDGLDYSCPVLLWILLLGRLSAEEAHATWYQDAIVKACNAAKVENWFEAKDLMQDLPWVQPHLEERIKAFCLFDEKYGLVTAKLGARDHKVSF